MRQNVPPHALRQNQLQPIVPSRPAPPKSADFGLELSNSGGPAAPHRLAPKTPRACQPGVPRPAREYLYPAISVQPRSEQLQQPASIHGTRQFGDSRCLQRAGIAIGVIDAAVHTIIGRKTTAPTLFDDTPVGLRRRRAMVEGMQRLEQQVQRDCAGAAAAHAELDVIAGVVALDYLQFRFADAPWRVPTPALDAWVAQLRRRPAFADTVPR